MGKQSSIYKDKKQTLYERASPELIDLIQQMKKDMMAFQELLEKIRDKALEEDFTPTETKMLIAVVCEKMALNPTTKKKFIAMTYPQDKSIAARIALARSDPIKELGEEPYIDEKVYFISFDVIDYKDWLHILRMGRDRGIGKGGFYVKIINDEFNNAKSQNEKQWFNAEDYEIETAIPET